MAREPLFGIISLLFPVILYLLFGLTLHRGSEQANAARYFLASYTVFGVMAPGLFGFGLSIAIERAQGLFTLRRAMPTPVSAYLAAKMIMSALFACILSCVLLVIGTIFGGVHLHAGEALALVGTATLGVVPFCAIGLLVGAVFSHQSALAVLNLLYLGMGLLSGMLVSPGATPAIIAATAPIWPSYHLAQVTFRAIDAGGIGRSDVHFGVLAVVTVMFFGLATRELGRRAY